MAKPEYFENALSNFTFETACGGAIRHLTDLGYSTAQIAKQLCFPTSYERIQKAVWTRLLDTGVILLAQPGSGETFKKAEFIKEYDKYGKVSFRKVSTPAPAKEPLRFLETSFNANEDFASALREKCAKNGPDASYASCGFASKKGSLLADCLAFLDKKQQEYLTGLPWPNQPCYHRLDARMQEIIIRLYESDKYQGTFFFLSTKEKIEIPYKK